MVCSRVKKYNGEPTIFVDDKPIVPMFMLMRKYENDEYIKSIYDSGIKVFFVYAELIWLRKDGFEKFKTQVNKILKNAPDSYIFVRIIMHPPKKWVDENPDEVVRYSDGKTMPCKITWGIDFEEYSGHYSMASEKWQYDAGIELERFCKMVDESVFSNRIIGYFFCAGGTCEWYYMTPVIDYEEKRVADYSPAFKMAYTKYLREKYKTSSELKKSWRMQDADFENPYIPDIEMRNIVDKGREFVLYAKNRKSYYGAFNFDCSVELDNCIDAFIDADHHQCVIDFYDAWHKCVADSIIYFSNIIKKRYNNNLVTGAFFGACGCTNFYDAPTSGGATRVIKSGVVDILSTPGTYINRYPGGCLPQRAMIDSMRINNVVFVSEEDCRTHLSEKLWRVWNRIYTEKDSINTLKRDFARNICDMTYSWWFDLSSNGWGWYNDDVFFNLFSRQQRISNLAYKFNKGKANEIAAIYSENSFHTVTEYTTALMVDYYRNSELYHIGTGIDFYYSNDLENENMPDYKVYIMVNMFCMTDKEREIIREKTVKNKAMVIWLYAPGFINPDKKEKVSTKNIECLTDMKVKMEHELCVPTFSVIKHDAVKYAGVDRNYGHIDREYISSFSFYDEVGPHIEKSYFYIEDDSVITLGRYNFNDKTALAMKKNEDGVTNVYCTSRILRSELLTSLAEYAGVHIFNFKDDVVFSNNNFLTVHASYTGVHTIYFKEKCNPYEVYENKFYGDNIDFVEIEMKKGDTLMFSVNDELSEALNDNGKQI